MHEPLFVVEAPSPRDPETCIRVGETLVPIVRSKRNFTVQFRFPTVSSKNQAYFSMFSCSADGAIAEVNCDDSTGFKGERAATVSFSSDTKQSLAKFTLQFSQTSYDRNRWRYLYFAGIRLFDSDNPLDRLSLHSGSVYVSAPFILAARPDIAKTQFIGQYPPSITAMFPQVCSEGGGVVLLQGTNFPDNAMVAFGQVQVQAEISKPTERQLACIAPPHTAGQVPVFLTNGSNAISNAVSFTYLADGKNEITQLKQQIDAHNQHNFIRQSELQHSADALRAENEQLRAVVKRFQDTLECNHLNMIAPSLIPTSPLISHSPLGPHSPLIPHSPLHHPHSPMIPQSPQNKLTSPHTSSLHVHSPLQSTVRMQFDDRLVAHSPGLLPSSNPGTPSAMLSLLSPHLLQIPSPRIEFTSNEHVLFERVCATFAELEGSYASWLECDANGNTLAHHAVANNCRLLVQVLTCLTVTHKLFAQPNGSGITPMALAAQLGHCEDLLREWSAGKEFQELSTHMDELHVIEPSRAVSFRALALETDEFDIATQLSVIDWSIYEKITSDELTPRHERTPSTPASPQTLPSMQRVDGMQYGIAIEQLLDRYKKTFTLAQYLVFSQETHSERQRAAVRLLRVCQCLIRVGNYHSCAAVLHALSSELMAKQVFFAQLQRQQRFQELVLLFQPQFSFANLRAALEELPLKSPCLPYPAPYLGDVEQATPEQVNSIAESFLQWQRNKPLLAFNAALHATLYSGVELDVDEKLLGTWARANIAN